MNRILDCTPSPEETVVSRILVQVHKAVDDHFPGARQTSRQFTKTVFSEEEAESTAIVKSPVPEGSAFADVEDTVPDGNKAPPDLDEDDEHELPPPPPPPKAAPPPAPAAAPVSTERPQSYVPELDPMRSHLGSQKPTEMPGPVTADGGPAPAGPDWVTMVAGAVLLAGLVMLVYLLVG